MSNTTKKQHKHVELIKKWVDDQSLIVQHKDDYLGKWVDNPIPSWDERIEFRFKPEEVVAESNIITLETQKRREYKLIKASWNMRSQWQIIEKYSELIYKEAGLKEL